MVSIAPRLAQLAAAAMAAPEDGTFWMPERASSYAGEVDWLFYFIYWVSVFFFCLIAALMTVFLLRYRKPPGARAESQAEHNTVLEIVWSVIPLIIVIVIFLGGFKGYLTMAVLPDSSASLEILVNGQKWQWTFQYPNGYVDKDLHAPVDRPVRLVLSSSDVIHSLYIPAFRLKKDAVPGRYNKAWFRATRPGEYNLYCAEYCGTAHSAMIAQAIIHPRGGYEAWLEDASNFLERMSPADAGRKLYNERGCSQCHSTDGRSGTGPSFLGIYEKEALFSDGTRAMVDENYIRESIMEPMAKIVAGYQGVMPSYQGRLKDAEITALIAYIKTLKEE
ncbi:MAG: Cytochrome c oxidase subunit 2 precursor [candidate division BRC1 bacterium ADurb.BinA364]|nr:MAG: Cytochrome c oxidase subunit 2 precursor [candidate division BRC1 bacterium ADurb.BinA364]